MALFRKFFYRKPPDGLLEISERVYVFDCCFTTDVVEKDKFEVYIGGIASQLRETLPDSTFMVFNFREGEEQSQIGNILTDYDMTVMDYPRHYEGCPLLTMEMIHHFLRSSENWLSLGQQNVLLMHCEKGGWPILAFMLAALLIYRKQYTGEQKTLDMIYKQAPRELLVLMSPLNPIPSQLRYLQYVSRRNLGSQWPPLSRALTLDCIILRFIPNVDGEGGCRPIFRIYGPDPLNVADQVPKVLFSTPRKSKIVRHHKQEDCELVKIDIHCFIQGDVVLECLSLADDLENEQMVFRVMFNTSFIRSNILMLNRDDIDILWNSKDQFPKEFRAEVIFSEMDAASSLMSVDLPGFEEKDGLPVEAFAKVQEIFSSVDWLDSKTDAAMNVLQQIKASNILQMETGSPRRSKQGNKLPESTLEKVEEKPVPKIPADTGYNTPMDQAKQSIPSYNLSRDVSSVGKNIKSQEQQIAPQSPALSNIFSSVVSQNSVSFPTSNPNVSLSLGITALQQKDVLSRKEVVVHPGTVLVTSSSSFPSSISVSGPVQLENKPSLPVRNVVSLISTSSISKPVDAGSPSSLQLSVPSSSSSQPLQELSTMGTSPRTHPPTNAPVAVSPCLSSTSSRSSVVQHSQPTANERGPSLVPSSVSSLQEEPPSHGAGELSSPTPSPLPTSTSSIVKDSSTIIPKPTTPPPPPPLPSGSASSATIPSQPCAPPPPPPPSSAPAPPLPPPPPPASSATGPLGAGATLSQSDSRGKSGVVPPPVPGSPSGGLFGAKGPGSARPSLRGQSRKNNLKPYHWLKLSRAVQGSLWAETQKSDEASKPPEFDMSELESLFSAAVPAPDQGAGGKSRSRISGRKPDKVQLVELRRANNCEIMLTKVKIPIPDLMSSVLALDDSLLDIDQVENLIKFCPTKEEMDLLKGYSGNKENLGKCEQFFLELMKVPRVESKLRVFAFKIQFDSQVTELRESLNIVNSASEEIRNSVKLKRIMQTILSLGNALNHGTARGSAVGFRLDSLLKLTDTRARNNKMTLMHYLCKVLAEKLPELLDFPKDLVSLEAAIKIQLKFLAEEMQAISKGLEKVVQELTASENDGAVSENFCKLLKDFLGYAEAEVRSLALLYSNVGRSADALALYFGEDPARCTFEQVVSTLRNFVKMFVQAHEENCKQIEFEKKKAQKDAENEKLKNASGKEGGNMERSSITSGRT